MNSGPGGPPRLLIVTADDFGLTVGVSRGILRAYREGIVTTASILAVGAAFELAAGIARDEPGLRVGAHLAMVGEDPPLLSADEIPTLVDGRGRFPLSWRGVLRGAVAGRLDPDDVRREFSAQLERMRGAGLTVTHLDTHQHVHLWPVIGEVVISLARLQRVPAIRAPRSHRPLRLGIGVNLLSHRLREGAMRAGLAVTEGFAGLDEAGRMNAAALAGAIDAVAESGARTAEINAHPGEHDDAERARFAWGYAWGEELDALVDPAVRAHAAALDYRTGSYADLAAMRAAV